MQNFLLVPVCFPDLLDIVNSEIIFFLEKETEAQVISQVFKYS